MFWENIIGNFNEYYEKLQKLYNNSNCFDPTCV